MDSIVLEDIANFAEKQLWQDICSERGQSCGFAPLISAMQVCRCLGANHSKAIAYGTSGNITHNDRAVVGYGSGLFYKLLTEAG